MWRVRAYSTASVNRRVRKRRGWVGWDMGELPGRDGVKGKYSAQAAELAELAELEGVARRLAMCDGGRFQGILTR